MSRPDGETELRPPDAQPGDHVGSLCQDLAGEASLLNARPPQQLPERKRPGSQKADDMKTFFVQGFSNDLRSRLKVCLRR